MARAASAIPEYARVSDLDAHWNAARARTLKPGAAPPSGAVIYWMSRDQRAHDNWALLHAAQLAAASGAPLHVAFCLQRSFLGAPLRHFSFMLDGLEQVEAELADHGIAFHLLRGAPGDALPELVAARGAAAVVCDFSPLRVAREWRDAVAAALPDGVGLVEVDAHNVVPAWRASDKQEVGARTLRPKIERLLPEFLTEFPELPTMPSGTAAGGAAAGVRVDWAAVRAGLELDASVGPIDWCAAGERAAHAALDDFCRGGRLARFAAKRNDPNAHALSNLSPYYHFGQLAPQRGALRVRDERARHGEGVKSFIEESVVRRELADNYCFHQPAYDSLDGAAGWARDSLRLHAADAREHVYTRAELEGARTHEDVWNAAQTELATTGKMHGFMRMYWAKKILEWTASPEDALREAIYLNDKYSIDGRDPNGYVGIAWSVMGVHDMGWAERPIFGKIRYMNYNGCKRKFDVKAYVAQWGAGGAAAGAAAGGAKRQAKLPFKPAKAEAEGAAAAQPPAAKKAKKATKE